MSKTKPQKIININNLKCPECGSCALEHKHSRTDQFNGKIVYICTSPKCAKQFSI